MADARAELSATERGSWAARAAAALLGWLTGREQGGRGSGPRAGEKNEQAGGEGEKGLGWFPKVGGLFSFFSFFSFSKTFSKSNFECN